MDAEQQKKVWQDLYLGNGKPALTVRMALCEQEVTNVKDNLQKLIDDSRTVKLMLLGVLLTVVGDVVAHFLLR